MNSNIHNNRIIGKEFEKVACDYLRSLGYIILENNYIAHGGEIDVIAMDNNVMVFVEVKYRKDIRCGSPLEAVTTIKQKRISKAAEYYYTYHGADKGLQCRFDVIGILGDGTIKHIKNAFDYCRQG